MAAHTRANEQTDLTVEPSTLARLLPWLLIIGGIIGIICSFVLMYDQIQIWKNPSYIPACNLNPIVSCGSVIDSKQGEILGIPSPLFGLLAFPTLVTIGTAMLAGARFNRWFWQALEVGALGAVAFALWLFWLSMYRIHALCPFCLSVDVVIYTLFWYLTLYNIEKGHIMLPSQLKPLGSFMRRHHFDILITLFILIIALILQHFWYYFGQHV